MPEPAPRIYSAEYYDRLRAIEGAHWWALGMDDVMGWSLQRHLAGRSVSHALDLGCGSGTGLAWLRAHVSPDLVTGVDVSTHGLQYSQDRGAALVCGSATEVPLGDDLFDLVLCNDVLQHVSDDKRVLDEAFRVLAPGGLLYLRTNCRFLIPPQPGCLRLYTRHHLRDLLKVAGFETLMLSRANAVGSLFGVAKHYLSPRRTGETGGLKIAPRETAAPGAVDRLMRATLGLEARLMGAGSGLIPFGHSLVAVARKPVAD